MNTLPCGHVAHSSGRRACVHLLDESAEPLDQVRHLTGRGVEFYVCCAECDIARGAALVEICVGCDERIAADARGSSVPWRGAPGVPERPEPVDVAVRELPAPGAVADLAPVPGGWLALLTDGTIHRAEAGRWTRVASSSVPAEPDHEPWAGHPLRRRLHASPSGDVAAVVNDHGHHGQVIDLRTGAITMTLRCDDDEQETVPFSLAFTDHDGRTAVVHRTGWNRLDASDAHTGAALVDRGPTSYGSGEERPEHHLDYFHGRLALSPSGQWLADDGWIWHPYGAPAVWDVRRWLTANPWESEDGPSRRELCGRAYHWNSPLCWIDDTRLAIWGIGDDDEAMLDGVRIFDPASGKELLAFAGPRGALFSDGFRLYAAARDGLDIWDPATGERTGSVPGFVPTAHHRGHGELASIKDDTVHLWSTAHRPH